MFAKHSLCIVFTIVLVLCGSCNSRTTAAEVTPLEVNLSVSENDAGIARVAEPVSTGIPFKVTDRIYSVAGFGVFLADRKTEIPAQFQVLSRWYGAPDDESKPIRWVLVEFQADCGAKGASSYVLKTSGGSGTATRGIVTTTPTSTDFSVDTGEARFVIRKNGVNLFEEVFIKNPNENNMLTRKIVSGGTGPYLSKPDKSKFLALNSSVEVERQGPLHTILLLKGKNRNGSGEFLLSWKARIHFYYGKSFVKVDYSVTDTDTIPGITGHVPIDEIVLPMALTTSGEPRYTIAGETGTNNVHTDYLDALPATDFPDGALLLQTGSIDQGAISATTGSSETADEGAASTIKYIVTVPGYPGGSHSRGWVDLSDSEKGVTAAVKYFWQLYPKKLQVKKVQGSGGIPLSELSVHLWPSEVADLKFYCAAQKTHEILYYFHNGSAADAGSEALVASLFGVTTSYTTGSAASRHHKLVPLAPAEQYSESLALGYVGGRNPLLYPSDVQPLVTQYYKYVDNLLDRSLRERNSGGTRGGGHEYMMWSFGDSRDATWSNMAYDALRADALLFAATGERKFLDHLEEVTQHFRDVDVEHSLLNTRNKSGLSSSTPWLGRTRYNPAEGGQHDLGYPGRTQFGFEHYKGHGLADHYFLTGDPLSRDVLFESASYFSTFKDLMWINTESNVRVVSKPLGPILGLYQVTGGPTQKANADFVITALNQWQEKVTTRDKNGWMWMGTGNDSQSSAQAGLTMDFMIEYMKDIPAPIDVNENLYKACKFLIDPVNQYWTEKYFNDWPNYNYGVANATVIDFMAVAGLSYCTFWYADPRFAAIGKTALANAMAQDSSNGNLKPYAQKTRYVPNFLYWLRDFRPLPTSVRRVPSK